MSFTVNSFIILLFVEQEQSHGALNEDLASQGLSNLNWSADGTCQVFLNLALSVSKQA